LCDSQITFRSIMRTVDAKKTVDGPRTSLKGKCNPLTRRSVRVWNTPDSYYSI